MNESSDVIKQLIRLVNLLHSEFGVLHRDIKLNNIMVKCKFPEERVQGASVRLIDFGFSDYI